MGPGSTTLAPGLGISGAGAEAVGAGSPATPSGVAGQQASTGVPQPQVPAVFCVAPSPLHLSRFVYLFRYVVLGAIENMLRFCTLFEIAAIQTSPLMKQRGGKKVLV